MPTQPRCVAMCLRSANESDVAAQTAGDDQADTAHLEHPIPLESEDARVNEAVDVMKRPGAHEYESEDKRDAEKRHRRRCRSSPKARSHEHDRREHDAAHQNDERDLNVCSFSIPAVFPCDYTSD